jgi:hypothetical protein
MDPQHIPNDMESNDDDKDEHLEGDDGIMEFDGLMEHGTFIPQVSILME